MLFRNPKLVPSISIHLIRVICGGSIRDEKRHIPADFSILPVNGYKFPWLMAFAGVDNATVIAAPNTVMDYKRKTIFPEHAVNSMV